MTFMLLTGVLCTRYYAELRQVTMKLCVQSITHLYLEVLVCIYGGANSYLGTKGTQVPFLTRLIRHYNQKPILVSDFQGEPEPASLWTRGVGWAYLGWITLYFIIIIILNLFSV